VKKEKSAGAVIFIKSKEIKYLLLRHPFSSRTKKDYWGFPKGHIEKNEKELETVKREIKEETGLKNIKIVNGFKETVIYFLKNNTIIQKKVILYLAEAERKKIILSSEHIGYKWLNFQKAINLLCFKDLKKVLKRADNLMKENCFEEKIYKVVEKIPKGKVLSYKEVAQKAGYPKAWRAVGNVLNKNKDLIRVPCHRVIRSDKKIGGYASGQKKKIKLLKKEGIVIKNYSLE